MRYLPILTAAALVITTGLAQAGTCANLAEARTQLVAMIGEADAAKLDDFKAKIHAASAALDANLAAMAGGPAAAMVDAFKPAWDAFKETREGEIIPAVYAGDQAKAKGIATGIQAERMKTMKGPWAATKPRARTPSPASRPGMARLASSVEGLSLIGCAADRLHTAPRH